MTSTFLPGSGRVALVTGCGNPGGLGAATARALAEDGCTVVVSDLAASPSESESGLEDLVEDLRTGGAEADAVPADLRREGDCVRLVDACIELRGRLDVVVNNAAAPHGADRRDVTEVPASAWDEQMAVNLRAPFLICREAVRHLRDHGGGRIVNVSSLAALVGVRHRMVYSATKAGLIGLSRSLAADVLADGITVNCVCPGYVLTDRARHTAEEEGQASSLEEELARRAGVTPAGRLGTPEEVAAVVRFLASPEASYVTGEVVAASGGLGRILTL